MTALIEGVKISFTDPIINLLGLYTAAFSFTASFINGAFGAEVISALIGT